MMAGWRRLRAGIRTPVGRRIVLLYALLVAANLAAWLWALAAFHGQPVLLGSALLAYGFGLRHAVDADHIAAIDNVTRKLMQAGRRPVGVGLWFSLGHSTIVVLASAALAAAAATFGGGLLRLQGPGAVVGTLISASFLIAVATINATALARAWRDLRTARCHVGPGAAEQSQSGGLLARLLRPVLRLVTRSWHMYPLGLLFGLGFDTATEVALLGISATQAAHGLSPWSILVFPALFAAGMTLIDTTDGVLMLGAYGWAFAEPVRKLYYNLVVTGVSVAVALAVGGLEVLGLAADRWGLAGPFWDAIARLNGHFGVLGFAIIGLFAVVWAFAAALYRRRGYAAVESAAP